MPATPQDHKPAGRQVEINGETYTLANPKVGLLRKVRKLDPLDLMFTLFEECGTPEFLAAIDELDAPELNAIFSDWSDTLGGGDAGKSGGSSS